jgi:hypothetical protein
VLEVRFLVTVTVALGRGLARLGPQSPSQVDRGDDSVTRVEPPSAGRSLTRLGDRLCSRAAVAPGRGAARLSLWPGRG